MQTLKASSKFRVKLAVMKYLIFTLLLTSLAHAGDPIRDLKKHPLSFNELSALKAAKKLARQQGERVSAECVNASMGPGTEPVSVQFVSYDEEGRSCVDPHYSIEVEFQQQRIISVRLIDS